MMAGVNALNGSFMLFQVVFRYLGHSVYFHVDNNQAKDRNINAFIFEQ